MKGMLHKISCAFEGKRREEEGRKECHHVRGGSGETLV